MGGGLAAATAAPFVPLLQSEAGQLGPPKRLLIVYVPSGMPLTDWRCSGGESDFTLSPILSPLAPFQDRLLVLDGLDVAAAYHSASNGQNHRSIVAFWTGHELQPGNILEPDTPNASGWPNGASVDQVVAAGLVGTTPLPSLELGVFNRHQPSRRQMIHAGPSQPVPIEDDPYVAFDKIFGELDLDASEAARLKIERQGVIDVVQQDLATLQAELRGDDRFKVEAHIDNLDGLAQQLAATVSCDEAPGAPEVGLDPDNMQHIPELTRLQMDLVVQAFTCDVTRVASLLWANESNNVSFSWLGHDAPHHTLSHDDPVRYAECWVWLMEQMAYLLSALDAVDEGAGTLLDNTVVVWASAIGESGPHTNRNVPVVLAGSCGGYFQTGRYLRWGSFDETTNQHGDHGGRSVNDLYLSLCHAMGLDELETFGDPQYCDGLLEGLT